jgi:hypothetical protein
LVSDWSILKSRSSPHPDTLVTEPLWNTSDSEVVLLFEAYVVFLRPCQCWGPAQNSLNPTGPDMSLLGWPSSSLLYLRLLTNFRPLCITYALETEYVIYTKYSLECVYHWHWQLMNS